MNYGRGFDPSEIVGDDGIVGKVEVRWTPDYNPSGKYLEDYHMFTFLDAGRVWNKDSTTSADKRNSATSTGAGFHTEFVHDVSADFTVAFPLNREIQTKGDKSPRFLFGLTKSF
jgi:hemolysin activation/secretion protein